MEKSKELLEIEKELGKTRKEFFSQDYIPPPTVEDALEMITLAGEGLYSDQLLLFVEAVRDGLSAWLEKRWHEEAVGLGIIRSNQ